MTWKRPVLVLATVAATVAGMVTSTAPAAAGTPFRPAIVCDSTANTISASVSGGHLVPGQWVDVEFRVHHGSYVTATTQGSIPQMGQLVTVPAVTAADGTVRAAGYSRPWPSANYQFYTETVNVTVRNTSGVDLIGGRATCFRDLRTAVALTCDQQAHTITATSAGTGFTRTYTGAVLVEYTTSRTFQATRDDPRWTSINTMPPDFSHRVAVTGGAWTDLGYVHTIAGNPYYAAEKLSVVVRDNGLMVGRGEVACVYADQSGT